MYDIRQFRPALYTLLMLGVTGFALSAEAPGLWILAAGGIMLNAWLVKTGRFTPMPRLLANGVTLGAVGIVVLEVRSGGNANVILSVGQFIVLLHLIKLFEQRANRDYAQLLVLSLLLMVAAAISTASLVFGMMLIAYVFLSLHCCLLFHLKVEVDQARAAYRQPAGHQNPAQFRQDPRDLPRSMRRLTSLISLSGVAMAVLVFLFFPRGAGQQFLEPMQLRASEALTGFNDQVGFQKVAQIAQNDDVVARVELYYEEQKVTHPTEPMLLRGSALDVYTGNNAKLGGIWQWCRSQSVERTSEVQDLPDGSNYTLTNTVARVPWRQDISLQPTGTNKLFAMEGLTRMSPDRHMKIRYSQSDGVLESDSILLQPIKYQVWSTGEMEPEPTPDAGYASQSAIDPAVARYARQSPVCGQDRDGKLLSDYPLAGNHAFDHDIAANIERYLRNNFSYTLDLTNIGSLGDRDPMAAFLTDFKKGHCEYFAGAMTLMCQSLNIPARMIVGFRCEPSDFNPMGDYFLVKQSDAHAWCEVYTGQKWEVFDPTSGRGVQSTAAGYLSDFKKFFDYLEFKWANNVVAYDTGSRRNLIDVLNYRINSTAVSGSQNVLGWTEDFQKQIASPTVLSCVITGMISMSIVAVCWFAIERWRLHRRARRIGLSSLSTPEQLRLVRQLGFYDDLLRVLERHRIPRPKHLTPLEFSQSLSYLPASVYDDIYRLTKLFYRIRYGEVVEAAPRQRHLAAVIHRIQQALDSEREIPI